MAISPHVMRPQADDYLFSPTVIDTLIIISYFEKRD